MLLCCCHLPCICIIVIWNFSNYFPHIFGFKIIWFSLSKLLFYCSDLWNFFWTILHTFKKQVNSFKYFHWQISNKFFNHNIYSCYWLALFILIDGYISKYRLSNFALLSCRLYKPSAFMQNGISKESFGLSLLHCGILLFLFPLQIITKFFKTIKHPVRLPCQHHFCQECVANLNRCHICDRAVNTVDLCEDKVLSYVVESSREATETCANCDRVSYKIMFFYPNLYQISQPMFFCETCQQPLCSLCRETTHKVSSFWRESYSHFHLGENLLSPSYCPIGGTRTTSQ